MESIPLITWKFSPSLPFGDSTPTISCNEPRRTWAVFVETLQPKEGNKQQKMRHVKGHYGEALTSDEVYERGGAAKKAEKREIATTKKKRM